MDEKGTLGEGESRVTYFVHKCLHCSRMLYLVLNAQNICGACFRDTITISKSDLERELEDGEDEEEGED